MVMKKIFFILVALCAMVSCSKDELKNEQGTEEIAFIAAPLGESNGDTKTTVDVTYDEKTGKALTGKVSWNLNDEVVIYKMGEEGNIGIYKVSAVDSKGWATLSFSSGIKLSGTGTYCATYGDVSNQVYVSSTPGSNCPMEAKVETKPASDSGTICELWFTNTCGVVAVVANTKENVIAEIRIGRASLAFQTPSKLNGTYLIAVPDGEKFSTVTFVKTTGAFCSNTISSTSVSRNKIRRMNTGSYFGDNEYIEMTTDPEVLPGEFKVAANKYVHFVKGNVCCNAAGEAPIWGFETEQFYGVPTSDIYNAAHVNHFYHDKYYGYRQNSNGDGGEVNWGKLFKCPTGYSSIVTLSSNEWAYMIDARSGYGNANYLKVYINGMNGVIFFPPSFNIGEGGDWNETTMGEKPTTFNTAKIVSRSIEQFRAIEAAGGVLLMSAGVRANTGISYYPGQKDGAQPNAYYACEETNNIRSLWPGSLFQQVGGSAYSAYSVRLAVVIDKTPATTN